MKKAIVTAAVTSAVWITFFGYVAYERERNRRSRRENRYYEA